MRRIRSNKEVSYKGFTGWLMLATVALSGTAYCAGCGGGDSNAGGAGGAGGAGSISSSSSSSSSSSGSSSSSSSSSGAGGGSQVSCLPPAEYSDLYKIVDPDFCAVAVYTASDNLFSPTWGKHNGPLTVAPGTGTGAVVLTRWAVPTGSSGVLTPTTSEISANIPAKNAFLASQAIDLPFFNWTALSWAGSMAPTFTGEVILSSGNSVSARYPVNGFFSATGVAAARGQGRLLYSGLSTVQNTTTSKNALYAADSCGNVGQNPRLIPDGDATCGEPVAVAAWGDASGPVAADINGNVFAIAVSFAGGSSQEARGFAAPTVARHAPPSNGDVLFTVPGFGSSFAAIAPSVSAPGVLTLQSSDPVTFNALDVIAQRYNVSGNTVQPLQTPTTFLKLTTENTSLSLFTDSEGRLWVSGPAGTGSKIVVITRK